MLTEFKCFEEPTGRLSWASSFHRMRPWWFCDSVISDSLLALSVHGKTVLFHLSLRQAHMSTTCQVRGDPVRSHVDVSQAPPEVREGDGGGGGRRGAVSGRGKTIRSCLIWGWGQNGCHLSDPTQKNGAEADSWPVWPKQVSCLSRPSMCNACHPFAGLPSASRWVHLKPECESMSVGYKLPEPARAHS